MLFSVIIPIYNAEKTLRRCLDSLIPQAKGIAELILINDGSTDGSEQICLEYKERYSGIVYILKENGGVSSARNMGISAAKGEYITFVDSDDYVSSDYFSALSIYKDVDFLYFSAETEKEGSCSGYISGGNLRCATDYFGFILEFLRLRNGAPWNKRFRSSIVHEYAIRFPTELTIGEDFVFCFRYLMAAKTGKVIEDVLYFQDESCNSSLTKRYNKNMVDQALRIYSLSYEAVDLSDLSALQIEKIRQYLDYNQCRTAFACAMEYFKTGETKYCRLKVKIKTILSEFNSEMQDLKPIGFTHNAMRQCITNEWVFPVYWAAKWRYNHKQR